MITRSTALPLLAAAALALTACSGGSDDDAAASVVSTPTETAPRDATSDESPDAVAETAVEDEAPDVEADSATDAGCTELVTPAEVESIFGVAPEITGVGERCQMIFASDAVGGVAVFSGSKADEAISTLLAGYEANEYNTTNGTLLADGRGYFVDGTVVVRGDSGRVFSLGIPENLATSDFPAAVQTFAELLLTR